MSVAKTSLLLCVLGLAAAQDQDYADWKVTVVNREYSVMVQPLYMEAQVSLNNCIKQVDGTKGAKVVQFHNATETCMLFGGFDTSDEDVTKASTEFSLYYSKEKEPEDDSITAGEIVATIILSITFFICLVGLAIVCKSEETDIAAQMERLEKAEGEKEAEQEMQKMEK